MTWEQFSSIVTAVGTFGGPVVAVVAILASNRTNIAAQSASRQALDLAKEQLDLARQERAAVLRETLFEARLHFIRQHSKAISDAPALADAYHNAFANYRQYPESDAKEKEWEAARDELQDLRRGLLAANSEAAAILPDGYLSAFKAVRLDLFRILNAGNETMVERQLANLEDNYGEILKEGRRMLHVDALDPQLLASLGKFESFALPTPEESKQDHSPTKLISPD